ncbi:hypothetical protein OU995_22210 [Roseateles sp. SL47]|uniref:hypothetical protein n=1 Tax=Roseateles sp. SL47 TaxID=2995138 RepID=UPI00226E5701|nr:hypothetical protein [Roseateles sp. SL47]WAC72247.1 hypothetical protein OU995_22210 [Roseateles sp. SL47]
MKQPLILGTLAAALLVLPQAGQCAEIVLEQSAVQTLLMEGMFKEQGRLYLQKGACQAYLTDPQVTLQGERVTIRVHLSGKLGVPSGSDCLGVALTSWATVSATPVAQGQVVRLAEIRVDEVEDPNTRNLLNLGLAPALPGAIQFDVQKAVQDMLKGSGSRIQGEVQSLKIDRVRANDNKLSIRFDFSLVGR